MIEAVPPRRNWRLPAAILAAMGIFLWADPITVFRTRQSAQAIKDDPNSGAGIGLTTVGTGPIVARRIDQTALAALLKGAGKKLKGTAMLSLLVDAEGRVSDVRVIGGSLTPEIAIAAVQILEGQRLFQPVLGAPTVRTLAGPLSLSQSASGLIGTEESCC